MEKKVNIVLVLKSGGRYNVEDVRLLAYHLHKQAHLHKQPKDVDINITCIYDKIKAPMRVFNVDFVPMPHDYDGWWAKMNLFAPEFADLKPFLYIDLDTVIIRPFGDILPIYGGYFTMLSDFYKSHLAASGIMWIPDTDKLRQLWDTWKEKPKYYMNHYRGDGEYIRSVVKAIRWQDITKLIGSFKPEPRKKPLERRPRNKAIICFHGRPSIKEVDKNIKWIANYIKEYNDSK